MHPSPDGCIMVDITPEDIKMMQEITKTDCGELEFQLGYYTEQKCDVVAHTNSTIDVVVHDNDYLSFIIILKNTDSGLQIQSVIGVHERKEEINMFWVDKAIQTFNKLWVK